MTQTEKTARVINDAGRALVMLSETLALEAYRCPAGKLTIGYGHTGDVREGQRITQHQAEAILHVDLMRFETLVDDLAPESNANQFSAMVSLAFNIGGDAFSKSSLLRKFKAGLPVAAASEFSKWIHVKGQVLPGLVKRRAAEAKLFLTPLS